MRQTPHEHVHADYRGHGHDMVAMETFTHKTLDQAVFLALVIAYKDV